MNKKITYFALLCFLSMLFSCNHDEDLMESKHYHTTEDTRMNKVSFQEMKNFIKKNAIGTFPSSLNAIFNKGSDPYITNIDSTQITQISYDGVVTFTLPVKTIDEGKYTFSDLIFNIKNGEVKEYIYHYNPSENWIAEFNSGNKMDYEGELVITDTVGNELSRTLGTMCFMAVDIPCYGTSCPCTDGNGQTIYVKVECSGGSGGGQNPTGDGPTTPSGPGGFNPQEGGGGTSTTNTPCQKVKTTYNNTAVKSRYGVLKPLTSASQETGYGFKTVSNGMGGTTTQTNSLNPDSSNPDKMKVGIFPTSFGYIHTHLDKTDGKIAVKIFSPADINTFIVLLNNAVNNSIPLGNIFGGMLASDPDTNYNIYQLHYTGNGSDIPAELDKEELDVLREWYRKESQKVLNDNEGTLSHSDMQKLLFKLLKKMNVKSVVLGKIEDSNPLKTKIINFNNDGIPSEQNCL